MEKVRTRQSREEELTRMLLWFKAQLPSHELGYWELTSQPAPRTIENVVPPHTSRANRDGSGFWIRGHGECVRCHQRYEAEGWANATAHTEDDIARVVENAKEMLIRDAAQDGPCWGDVPKKPIVYGAKLDLEVGS